MTEILAPTKPNFITPLACEKPCICHQLLIDEARYANFWENQCRAVGKDLEKALLEIKRLGGIPIV
jgi:hypothetical protein